MVNEPPHVLVLGASGYVGGRLVPRLLAAGHRVRCLVRAADRVRGLGWSPQAEVIEGDLLDPGSVTAAFAGVDVVYHLVHSMGGGAGYAARDRSIATTVAQASAAAGVRRIIYLGGLGDGHGTHRSEHLRSRAEVGRVLHAGPVPVTSLRAAIIIGSGSASFEMLRHLVEVLPVMVTPRWVRSRVQPIAIRDVLRYLVGVLAIEDDRDHTYDIAGPDVLTYRDMMTVYADVAGLPRRMIIGVHPLTPRLSSHWVGLVTPVPASIARPLVEGLVHDAVASTAGQDIAEIVPGPCIGYRRALQFALRKIRDHDVETSWREADPVGQVASDQHPGEPYPGDPSWNGGTLYTDVRETAARAPAAVLFDTVCRIGGATGWPTHRWAWQLRGLLDRVVGGVGLRRGRRDSHDLRLGDAIDFWRVIALDAPSDDRPGLLRLHAEMRLPGEAWLEFHVASVDAGHSRLRQRAVHAPKGLWGRVYWYALVPFHGVIFPQMAAELARQAERAVDSDPSRAAPTSSDAPTAPPAARAAPAEAADRDVPPARRAG